MSRIIPNYILRELFPVFVVSLMVFTFVLLLGKILQLTDLIVVKGVNPLIILKFLLLSLPFFLSLTIPMSTLLAVLLGFLRLAGDNEITALKSAGFSLYRLLPPVLIFCVLTTIVTLFLSLDLVPRSNRAFRNELLALAKKSADISVKEGIFNDEFKDMVLFINRVDLASGWMREIFIQDSRDPGMANSIIASRGRIATDYRERALVFELFDGVVDRVSETIVFDRYDLKLDMELALAQEALRPPDQFEMSQQELWRAIGELSQERDTRYWVYLLEGHKRYSLPFSCLVLGLIGLPLGVQGKSRGRNWGVAVGLGVFLAYYILFSMGLSFGENGAYPPAVGMWMPNVAIGLVGVYMIWRTANERPVLPDVFTWLVGMPDPARQPEEEDPCA